MMNRKLFTVSIEKEFDVTRKEFNNEIYLRVYTSLFKSGIVKELKPNNFTVLLAIASFMDSEGNCYPTQRQIAEITGLSLPTVNKCVNELLDFKVHDKPLIERKLVHQGQFKNSYYTVNPISQIAIFDGQVKNIETDVKEFETDSVKESLNEPLKEFELNNNQETITNITITNNNTKATIQGTPSNNIKTNNEPIFKNAKDIAVYFANKYREEFGVNYNIVFKRDLGLIKNKLMKTFTDEQIKTMIDTTISEYNKRWKKPKYPRPTISSMVSWIGQEALAIAEDSKQEFQELQELTSNSDDLNDDVLKKFGL
jgi:DNA-binding transcriptional regulator GbsR (MarR family)